MEIISRKDAHARGMLRFFTGKACKRNHIRERNVKTGACLGCLAHYAREYYVKNNDESLGFVTTDVTVHTADIYAIRAFAELLKQARIAGKPVPLVPHAAHVGSVNTYIQMLQPTTPASEPQVARIESIANSPETKHAMWVRIHGREIADQMLEQARA